MKTKYFAIALTIFVSNVLVFSLPQKGDMMNKYSQIKMITLKKSKVASYCFQYSASPEENS